MQHFFANTKTLLSKYIQNRMMKNVMDLCKPVTIFTYIDNLSIIKIKKKKRNNNHSNAYGSNFEMNIRISF